MNRLVTEQVINWIINTAKNTEKCIVHYQLKFKKEPYNL